MESFVDVGQQSRVLLAQCPQFTPNRRVERKTDHRLGRAQFEHLTDLEQLVGKVLGEAVEHPACIGPLLDEPEAAEAVEELADAGGRDAELTRHFQLIDLRARTRIAAQHPLHEALLDLIGGGLGFGLGEACALRDRPRQHAAPALLPHKVVLGQPGKHLANCRPTDAELIAQFVL